MEACETAIPDVKILKPRVFSDERGFFMETYNRRVLSQLLDTDVEFVQDNHSASVRNVLRGLHYQIHQPQGKLVRVISGEVFDVAVDMRKSSAYFGHSVSTILSADNHEQMWIPPGFAHGFLVLSERAEFLYKTTDFYAPEYERTLLWNDPDLGIDWPLTSAPILSDKDQQGRPFTEAEAYP
ncbi:dTDP-4-dehydrorhamnose 3,5-epimerase [Methylophaga sp. OBS1]|uniref:dTDP-4-dehydrorhamnose 3,5-epimerase n=1 Tax=Methylophaga sp. OBS1 TaxID=2991933 RepID=UPI00224D2DFD|nr:dTDP-4-dehydrorhamnose 3,5-epimerase [Methylophaga sp. OBS1]MCX4193387.1 dTDP-4-dehydrorhamnose 3,5-epimerase [Methylophaga sp. OBS1]